MPLEPYWTWKKTGKKICAHCKEQKPVAEFPWKSNRNAPNPYCKVCQLGYTRKWSENNAESVSRSQEKYRNNHRELLRKKWRSRGKDYYRENKEEVLVKRAEYVKKNREQCIKASRLAEKKRWFVIGDLVIYKFALYEVMKRTRGWFKIEKRYPWKDDFYYDTMPDTVVVIRRSLRRYMLKHHKNIEVEIEERFIPKL